MMIGDDNLWKARRGHVGAIFHKRASGQQLMMNGDDVGVRRRYSFDLCF